MIKASIVVGQYEMLVTSAAQLLLNVDFSDVPTCLQFTYKVFIGLSFVYYLF